MESNARPNRSDTHLSREDEARIEGETRDHFEELAPKRHTKPQRSEHSSSYLDTNSSTNDDETIPEYAEFQRLENDPGQQKLIHNGGAQANEEEFVETDYYKDLNCVDKQHHTTGTGFIKMEEDMKNGTSTTHYNTGEGDPAAANTTHHHSYHGNPATNDWIPADNEEAAAVSDKPNRSDN